MSTHLKKNIRLKHVALVGVLSLALIISGRVIAWQAPTAAAPGGNVSAPINTGSVAQTKTGNFSSQSKIQAQGDISSVANIRAVGVGNSTFGSFIGQRFCLANPANPMLSAAFGVPGGADANSQGITCIDDWADITSIANAALTLPTGTQTGQMLQWFAGSPGTNNNPPVPAGWVISGIINTIGSKVNILPNWQGINQGVALDVNGRVVIKGGNPAAHKSLIVDPQNPTTGQAVWGDPSPAVSVNRHQNNGGRFATIACNSGYIAVGGGGTCGNNPTGLGSSQFLRASNPTNYLPGGGSDAYSAFVPNQFPNAWSVSCTTGVIFSEAYVVCMKTANY